MLPMPDTRCAVAGARCPTQQRQQRQWCRQGQEKPLAVPFGAVLGTQSFVGHEIVLGVLLQRTIFAGSPMFQQVIH